MKFSKPEKPLKKRLSIFANFHDMHILHYSSAAVRMLVSLFLLKIFLPFTYNGLVYTMNKHKRKHNSDVYTYRLAQDKHRISINSRKEKYRFLVLFLHYACTM